MTLHGAPLGDVRLTFDRSIALVMGVNAYRRGIPPLRTAVHDADAVGALLEHDQGFTALLLRDDEVTCQRVRRMFASKFSNELGTELTERDRIFIYFAGHGLSLPSDQGPEGQLLLADADPSNPDTFLTMSELRRLVGALQCRHVFIVLDCCFAGTFRWSGNRVDRHMTGPAYRETFERFVTHRAWQVLVSASHDQVALDESAHRTIGGVASPLAEAPHAARIGDPPHSPFAAALLRALRGAADYTKDGLIVGSELEIFVRDEVERVTGVRQTPQLYKLEQHDRGEFVFQVPGRPLDLPSAPVLSLSACPYQGIQPFGFHARARFFGRSRVVDTLLDRIQANPLTVIMGPSGTGKSSLLAAGLAPALHDMKGWHVVEAGPGPTADEMFSQLCDDGTANDGRPAATLLERVTTWLSIHVSERLCLAIDQTESFEALVAAAAGERLLGELSRALEAHGARLRVVFTLRPELEPTVRMSALSRFWDKAEFVIPVPTHHELRDVIEGPARALELSFEPASLVDVLIDEALQASNSLSLLSVGLRELYVRCASRNSDRLLTESDYQQMGGLGGALCHRASALLQELVAQEPSYATTARHVFLRLTTLRDGQGARRPAHRDELSFPDPAETARAATLLSRFRDAQLVVYDKDRWDFVHDRLAREWPMLAMWRVQLGAQALRLRHELAEAALRWRAGRRPIDLWTGHERLHAASAVRRAAAAWLNSHERSFIAASLQRHRRRIRMALAAIAAAGITALAVWDLYVRLHVDYYRDYVRRWGEPQGVDRVTAAEARGRATTVELVRRGHLGHVVHAAIVHGSEDLARANNRSLGGGTELTVGTNAKGQRMPCQWDFSYEEDSSAVSTETARDLLGNLVYRLQYRGGSRDHAKAEFLDEHGDVARVKGSDAEFVEFVRSPAGRDIEKRYTLLHGEAAQNQDGIYVEQFEYDEQGHVVQVRYLDSANHPMKRRDGVAAYRSKFDRHGNEFEVTLLDEASNPARHADGFAGYWSWFDPLGNETMRVFFDEHRNRVQHRESAAGYRAKFDSRGNLVEIVYLDEELRPARITTGVAGHRSTFNEHGNETVRMYLDEAGNLTRDKELRVAGHRSKFDPQGNESERIYLDEAGRPMRSKDGIAGYLSTFDPSGDEVERRYFDEAHKPVRSTREIAGYRSSFEHHDETLRTYLDESGQPTTAKNGVAGFRVAYDLHRNAIKHSFIDTQGRPTQNNKHASALRIEYDDHGMIVRYTPIDEDGNPLQN